MYVVGGSGPAGYSAEILHADGTSWCSKKLFSKQLYYHTLSGMTACGGVSINKECWPHHNITVTSPVSLRKKRTYHSSWNSDAGIVLMGGAYSTSTSELVTNGVSQDYFDLEHPIYGSEALYSLSFLARVVISAGRNYITTRRMSSPRSTNVSG